eukprot:m.146828 g.146828  ORF g.146828 m.146828 type:complete len:297 (-) comp30502_c1_seq1:264-1154(-)
MGLCKHCRKVTSLFCYEHKVNVCEKCMVDNHQTCVVQTYLKWLEDCDFDPKCRTCGDAFDNGAEVVRLPCLHLMHLGCLDQYARSFPANTAPAGYTCPICTTGVVPPRNQAGPVAEAARLQLSRLAWSRIPARTISEIVDQKQPSFALPQAEEPQPIQEEVIVDIPTTSDTHSTTFSPSENVSARRTLSVAEPVVAHLVKSETPDDVIVEIDADDEKYARRPVNTRIARLVTNQLEQAGHFASSTAPDTDVMGGLKKTWILIIILMMGAIALVEAYTKRQPHVSGNEIQGQLGDIQ